MANRFLPAVVPSLRERLRSAMSRLPAGSGDALQELALRTLERADRVMGQLESTAGVLDKVAHLQLAVMQKLEPIVDDLGRLVRLQLDEARRRITGPSAPTSPRVIEVSSEESPGRSHE